MAEAERDAQVWRERVQAEKVKGQLMLSQLKIKYLANTSAIQHEDSKFCSSREYLGLIADDRHDVVDDNKFECESADTDGVNSPAGYNMMNPLGGILETHEERYSILSKQKTESVEAESLDNMSKSQLLKIVIEQRKQLNDYQDAPPANSGTTAKSSGGVVKHDLGSGTTQPTNRMPELRREPDVPAFIAQKQE